MKNILNNPKGFIKNYLKELSIAIIFLLAYFPTFIWMWDRWFASDSYYSHGILVPLVTLFLIWQKKDELKNIKRKESPMWGICLMLIGVTIHILSSVLRVYFTSGFSMLITLVGILLYFFGSEILKKITFPIAFLVFMIPLPMVVITNISFKLKIFAAEIATIILNRMRLFAIREGSVIKMRSAFVIVEDVCSGLRSLITLTALGSIFAYWMKSNYFKKTLLFLSTIPIAVITNVCRVVLLAAVSEIWGTQYTEGLLHDVSGFMVFGLAFILLFAVGKILE